MVVASSRRMLRLVTVVVAVGCGEKRDPPPAPITPDAAPIAKPVPAVTIHEVAGTPADLDVCALLEPADLKAALDAVPKQRGAGVFNTERRSPDRNVAECWWGKDDLGQPRLTLRVGSEAGTGADRKAGEEIAGLGDRARLVASTDPPGFTPPFTLWVWSGARVLLVQGESRDLLAPVAKAALPRLGTARAKRPLAERVGGPAVDPCTLLDAAAVGRSLGTTEAIVQPGHASGTDLDYVGCTWAHDHSRVTVAFMPAAYWTRHQSSGVFEPGPTIAGRKTLGQRGKNEDELVIQLSSSSVQLTIHRDGITRDELEREAAALVQKL